MQKKLDIKSQRATMAGDALPTNQRSAVQAYVNHLHATPKTTETQTRLICQDERGNPTLF